MFSAKKANKLVKISKKDNLPEDYIEILVGIFKESINKKSQYDFEYSCHSNKECRIKRLLSYLKDLGYDVVYSTKIKSNYSGEPMDYDDSTTTIYTCIVSW